MPTQPQTVTIAQARASTASGLLVVDTGANIVAALPNAALTARIASFTLSVPAALTAAQMSLLFPITSKFHAAAGALQLTGTNTFSVAQLASFETLSGFAVASTGTVTLADTETQIVTALFNHLSWFAQVTAVSVQLDGSSMGAYPATLLENMILHGKTVVFVPTAGHSVLTIFAAAHDLATNAASLNALGTHQALTISVNNDGTAISAVDAASLLTLQGFSPSSHTLTVADTGANIAPRIGTLLGTGYGQITVTSGTLAGTASQLLDPTVHFATGAHAQLSASTTVACAVASGLAALPGFSHATGAVLTVADTAANLIATSSAWLAAAGAVSVTANATVSSADATQLSSIAAGVGGSLSLGGHSLTISDTLSALTALSSQASSLATSIALSANATTSAAQLAAFVNLPNATFSGHTVSVVDTAANLLAAAGALALASSVSLSANATVSAANANTLATLPDFSTSGHVLTVSDTAAGLLSLSFATSSLVSSVSLSADASVTAQQAQVIYSEPGFSTAGHQLSIVDTAANLLALPHGLQVAATSLSLSSDQMVSAATATQLAALGIKFSEAGHTVVIEDTAANLASLSGAAVALAGSEMLGTSATISASTAASLTALPNFSLASGVTLLVQDNVANLLALGQGASAFVGTESLTSGSVVTITAAQATALAALPHFSTAGATITIADSIANLNSAGSAILSSIGNTIDVVDTASNLAANATIAPVQNASSVTLSGNAQVTAAAAAQIASIPHFTSGAYQLTVADTAAHIASHAAAIVGVATQAVVTDAGPINIATADQLAVVSASGILSFLGGNQLLVQDSFAALTYSANSAGFALAARVGVIDTPANLVIASAYNWEGLNPSYTLSQGGVISAAVASSLAALGSHFSAGGYVLSVADSAAATIAAASALNSLHIRASVTDTAANLASQANSLLSLGSAISQVQVSDTTSLTASVASSLSSLSGLLAGPALQVGDTAAHVDASLAGLTTLGTHVAVTVTDSAANIGAHAGDLATLGSRLTIDLTDIAPVTASVAASLVPVAAELANGTILNVTDTGANIATYASGLSSVSSDIGSITVSDGTTMSASNAAAFASLDSHLAPGVMLTATGAAATITANLSALTSLNADHRLAAVIVSGATVADASANLTALNTLPTQVSISDTAVNVDAGLATLANVNGLQTIALTDAGTPSLSMSLATLAADATVVAKIITPYNVTVSDSAAHIAADLALGSGSVITAHLSQIGQISASDGQPVVLTQSQLLSAGIDDGPGSAMAKFSGTLAVTAVDMAHLSQVTALGHAPATISVVDTGSHIAANLALGNASGLVSALPYLTSITAYDNQAVSLTAAQTMVAGIDDSAHSAVALLQGASLTVTGASVADLSGLAGLYVQPSSISVSDTAADISADLASGNSALIASLPTIHAIAVSDGQTITLTEQQVLAAHVDDGAGSVLSETTGGNLAVTQVAAADLAEMLGLGVAPSSMSITDSAAHVVSNFESIVSDIGDISSVNITGAPLVLTAAEALAAHVDDGAGSLISLLAGHVFAVTGASVAQLPSLLALPYAPTSVAVSDSSSNIVGDLLSGSSALAAATSSLGTITVTHGTLTLTDAQADAIIANPSLDSVVGHLAASTVVSVTGAPISDLANLTGAGWPHLTVGVADTPANIATDLSSGSSVLLSNAATVGSVTLSSSGTVNAAALTEIAALPNFSTGSFGLTLQDSIASVQGLSAAVLALAHQVDIVDTGAHLSANLDALQTQFAGNLSITITDAHPVVAINPASYVADHATVAAVTNPGAFVVEGTASDVAGLADSLTADNAVASANVSDYAANVVGELDALQPLAAKLYVFLYDTQITANLVTPILGIANLTSPGIPVVDSGSQIAAVVETGDAASIAYLNANGASLADSTPVDAADAAALEGLTAFTKAGHSLVVWDTAQHLSSSTYAAALNNGLIDSVHLKAPGGTVTVAAGTAAILFGITGFTTSDPSGTPNTLVVSDTAAHIEANLAALTSNISHIGSVVVSSSAIISDSVLSDLQTLGASAGTGASLTVRDSGSVIAANAVAQSIGHSISPSAWVLSGNATLSEAAAATLGGLSSFSAGPYTITLNLGSDTSISIVDANKLGSLASSLSLGGYHLVVHGSAAQLSTLSSAALSVVTPALADTLANIDALSQTSPLLQGTVEVTGNDILSAAAVSTLFSLLRSGAGPGISAGSLTFDSLHTVSDSIANLRTLTGSAGWTANASLRSSFQLAAQDTVANLISSTNTAFLSGLSASTLQGDVTTSASTASSLAALSNTIHFSHGGVHITVQDNAENLLNAYNAGGVGLADTVLLAGPDHVDASDAEALLAITHFNLNTSLTIVDSSANLLDGMLSGDIAGSGFGSHIQVQLAGPETLDAQTAESLVSIPGFADTNNLTIADDPSYLLNSANLSAEQMAVQVTLAGDETVSANTVLRLSELPHFTPGSSDLVLASNDFANAATLKAIADMGSAFNHNGHSLTMTADALDLTPSEYTALQSDGVVQNGHALGIQPVGVTLSDTSNMLSVSGTGVAGGTVKIYAADGSLMSSNVQANAGFTVSAADTGTGHNFSVTESVNGSANEGAPLVVLDTATLESTVTASGGSFASSGAIQVDSGKFVNLYVAGSVPVLTHAALVYDPAAHTLALDVPGQSPVTLVTLGGSTHPATLEASEILFKTHG